MRPNDKSETMVLLPNSKMTAAIKAVIPEPDAGGARYRESSLYSF